MSSLANIPHPPPEMVAEIAYGMEDPVDIAFRYGYAASQYREMEQHKPFQAAVARARAELERNGHKVKVKSQWMVENLIDTLYLRTNSPTSTIPQIQETVKLLSKLADLEPKQTAQTSAGPGFSVVINLPGAAATSTTAKDVETIEVPAFPTFNEPVKDD